MSRVIKEDYYHHIDQGGIEFLFESNDGLNSVEFRTTYNGRTYVSSKMEGHELDSKVLKAIGVKFIEFAKLVADQENKQMEQDFLGKQS
jgi:hypothetical protein